MYLAPVFKRTFKVEILDYAFHNSSIFL